MFLLLGGGVVERVLELGSTQRMFGVSKSWSLPLFCGVLLAAVPCCARLMVCFAAPARNSNPVAARRAEAERLAIVAASREVASRGGRCSLEAAGLQSPEQSSTATPPQSFTRKPLTRQATVGSFTRKPLTRQATAQLTAQSFTRRPMRLVTREGSRERTRGERVTGNRQWSLLKAVRKRFHISAEPRTATAAHLLALRIKGVRRLTLRERAFLFLEEPVRGHLLHHKCSQPCT